MTAKTETAKTERVALSEIGFMDRFDDAVKVNHQDERMLDVIGAAHDATNNIDFVVVSINGEEENVPVYKIKDVFTQEHVDQMAEYPIGSKVKKTRTPNYEGTIVGYYVFGDDMQLKVDNGLGIGTWSISDDLIIVDDDNDDDPDDDGSTRFKIGDAVETKGGHIQSTVCKIKDGVVTVKADRRATDDSTESSNEESWKRIEEKVEEEVVEEEIEEVAEQLTLDAEEERDTSETETVVEDDTEKEVEEEEIEVSFETKRLNQETILKQAQKQLTETVGSTDRKFDEVETTVESVKFVIEYKQTAKSNWYVITAVETNENKTLVEFKVKIKDQEYQAAFDKALDYLKWYWVRL